MPSWLPQTQFKLQAVIVLYFWVLASFSSLPLLEASNVIYFQGKVVLSGGLPCFWVEGLSRQPCFHSLSTDWRSWPWTICSSQALQGHPPKEGRQRHRTIYTELFLPTQSGVPLWALRWLAPKQKGEAAVIFFPHLASFEVYNKATESIHVLCVGMDALRLDHGLPRTG